MKDSLARKKSIFKNAVVLFTLLYKYFKNILAHRIRFVPLFIIVPGKMPLKRNS